MNMRTILMLLPYVLLLVVVGSLPIAIQPTHAPAQQVANVAPNEPARLLTPEVTKEIQFVQAGASVPKGDVLTDLLLDHKAACLNGPVRQFGRYVGDWTITEQVAYGDGKTWRPGNGARWKFTCVGGGKAVQDYWIPNGDDGNPHLTGFGSNFRIYNPQNNSWDITWAGPAIPSFTHMRAREDTDGNMVLNWISPEQDPMRRVTFFAPDPTGWDWLLEISYDGGNTWTPVYKIRATPRA